jgi:hypothetical protein
LVCINFDFSRKACDEFTRWILFPALWDCKLSLVLLKYPNSTKSWCYRLVLKMPYSVNFGLKPKTGWLFCFSLGCLLIEGWANPVFLKWKRICDWFLKLRWWNGAITFRKLPWFWDQPFTLKTPFNRCLLPENFQKNQVFKLI